MARKNNNLHAAKVAKNDEFYTQLSDIEKELKFYKEHFRNKVVLCNCNDALHTGFATYFSLQFELLGLKELICTSFAMNEGEHGVVYRYKGDKNGNRIPDIEEWEQTPMEGNGGFNTPEGLALIDEADIVVTNPPFSLFREFIATMMEHDKKFLILGNVNAVSYKEVFPLIKDNKIWNGVTLFCGKMPYFKVNEDTDISTGNHYYDEQGNLYKQVNSICWFTNLDHKRRHEEIILYKKYNEEEYPKYDNYDAINVDKVCDIPLDYEGIMGVPITFLDKYCPEQFEVLDARDYALKEELKNKSTYLVKDADGSINGKAKYARILIRFKK
jgi:hypothetical protein